jgi:flagellar biosynthesis/type III secretory pathway chaperone
MTGAAATSTTLLDLLAEELRCCRRMVALAAAQRDAMLAGDVAALAPAVREMEGLAAVLARLEEERAAHAATLTPPPSPPAPRLAGAGPLPRAGEGGPKGGVRAHWAGGEAQAEAVQARLEELRVALRAALVELRALNDANAALARQALTATEQALRLFQAALPATYEANGALHPASAGARQTWTV